MNYDKGGSPGTAKLSDYRTDPLYDINKKQLEDLGKSMNTSIPASNGLPNSQGVGMKYDGGKQLGGLVYQDFTKAIKAVNAIGTFGAAKYKRSSWKHVPDAMVRYSDAGHRHLLDYYDGQKYDPESGLHHYAHYAWNVLAVLQLILEQEPLVNTSIPYDPKFSSVIFKDDPVFDTYIYGDPKL